MDRRIDGYKHRRTDKHTDVRRQREKLDQGSYSMYVYGMSAQVSFGVPGDSNLPPYSVRILPQIQQLASILKDVFPK